MIALGTKGDDGIDEGIHLRWAFNDKLGFPSCFKLYRRESDLKNKFEFPLDLWENIPGLLDLPYVLGDSFKFRLDSAITNGQPAITLPIQGEVLEDGTVANVLIIDEELTVLFSKAVSRVELKFVLEETSDFKIKILQDDGNFYPYHISGETPGLQNLSFDAEGATGLVLAGTGIKLHYLAAWICKKGKGWKRINNNCGCGLPVNLEGTDYLNDVYPPIIGRDLATVLCRLGFEDELSSPITLAEFLELKGMLLTMIEEGTEVPIGWTLFPNEEEVSEDDETEGSESLEFSKYDFLLTQSLHVFFAQIVDLYFVDKEAQTGKTYDYKITAKWPKVLKRRLDHEITFDGYEVDEILYQQIQLDEHTVLTSNVNTLIVDAAYELFRTVQGANIISDNFPTIISFLQPVTEVQLVLINPDFGSGGEIVVEAYKYLYTSYIEKEVLSTERGILRLRADQIDYIKIIATEVTVCSLHYDFTDFPVDVQEYIVCGVFKHTHLPLSIPTELEASLLPGGTLNDQDGNITEKPYMAGLHWEVNENVDKELISIAPTLYHIERKPHGGTLELLTEDAPLFVSPSLIEDEDRNVPIGWPKKRQYFTDGVSLEIQNDYRIAALDLFGRQSAFTEPVTYELTLPKPPHPKDVTAKFLDYSTYDPVEKTFKDTTINIEDQDWLKANGQNAIVVRWKWPENLQLQAPDIDGFNVHFHPGWLNTYTGMVTSLPVEETLAKTNLNLSTEELSKYKILDTSATEIGTHKFEISLDQALPTQVGALPNDAFRLCWLTQGNHSFLILKNTGMRLWSLKVNDIPTEDQGFGIAVTPDNDFFINYQDPNQWTDLSISYDKRQVDAIEEYAIYIENPVFPDPAIQASDLNKVRYAQIGVNSVIDMIKGSVSPAATIMALYWDAPATPTAFAPIAGDAIEALKAGPANIHGKSTFTLNWNDSGSNLKYQIYRALDETLFKIDNALRPARSTSIYTDFKSGYDFEESDVDVVQSIAHETDPVLVGSHYAALTPGQLQILACLPDNADAFSKINEGEIAEIDLSYADNTLNGQSNNHYFYALRSVDTNGLESELSLATPPVEIPKTTPPPVPVITAINGGENKVTVKWAKNPGADIAGYLVYRTQDLKKAKDSRKMELIKVNDTDIFSVSVNGVLPNKEFEFEDISAIARQAYYYGVVAVGLDDGGKSLPSRVSKAVVGQAYRITPPEPPIFSLTEWIRIDETGSEFDFDEAIPAGEIRFSAVKLEWTTLDPELMCMVQFSGDYFEGFRNASEWLSVGDSNFIHQNSYFNFDYVYRILVKDTIGNINIDFLESGLTAKIS